MSAVVSPAYPSSYVFTTLDDPSGNASTDAYSINNSGQIVGQYRNNIGGGVHGFLYSGGTYMPLRLSKNN
jgi:probable HAF family extracellular repeat protein